MMGCRPKLQIDANRSERVCNKVWKQLISHAQLKRGRNSPFGWLPVTSQIRSNPASDTEPFSPRGSAPELIEWTVVLTDRINDSREHQMVIDGAFSETQEESGSASFTIWQEVIFTGIAVSTRLAISQV